MATKLEELRAKSPDLLRLQREVLKDKVEETLYLGRLQQDHIEGEFRELTKEEKEKRRDDTIKAEKDVTDFDDLILKL